MYRRIVDVKTRITITVQKRTNTTLGEAYTSFCNGRAFGNVSAFGNVRAFGNVSAFAFAKAFNPRAKPYETFQAARV
jgi:hypothetical protein